MKQLDIYIKSRVPRVLTHLDRDIDSPTFGSFDRNYWHYKIQDFSSAVLQQSCYMLSSLPKFTNISEKQAGIWLKGSLNFWAKLATKNNALNEYYPYEESFPATAFSLQAISKVLLKKKYLINKLIKQQIKKTSCFLQDNFESKALNQQAASLAALVQVKALGFDINMIRLNKIKNKFFSLQSQEGWFPEYGGPDLGYLSVTLDMLCDFYEITKEKQAWKTMTKAVDFMDDFVSQDGSILRAVNSRETNYIVPYGLVYIGKKYQKAVNIFSRVYKNCNHQNHFLHSMDDRYHLHYCFNSLIKALPHTLKIKNKNYKNKTLRKKEHFFIDSKIFLKKDNHKHIVINAAKGGIIEVKGNKKWQDYGWRCYKKNKLWVSNYLNKEYKVNYKNNAITIKGYLIPIKYFSSSVIKNLILRFTSFLFGKNITVLLKKLIIFRKPDKTFYYKWIIDLNTMVIQTKILTKGKFKANLAINQPTRHVASAYNYSIYDIINHIPEKKNFKDKLFVEKKLKI